MALEGQQLGHYRLVQLIGSGGMGEVYMAVDTRINRQVAIKVVRTEASPYPNANATKEAVRLFQREMKTISLLDHPHILPLYDFGEESVNKTTLVYMVMPFRPEGSLTDWLQKRGQSNLLSPTEVSYLIQQAASALQHAHNRQVIHQDVKPSNFLILTGDDPGRPELVLADFGVAKFTSATSSMSHTIRGTPTYMAPEQWSGDPVPATDQYALAIMAYELLAGHPPFQGPPMRLLHLHATTPPQPPSTFNRQISPALDAVILRALAKQPADRFPSIAAFAQAFQAAVQGMSAPTMSAGPTPGGINAGSFPTGAATQVEGNVSRLETQRGTVPAANPYFPTPNYGAPISPPSHTNRNIILLVGLALLVIVSGFGAFFVLRANSSQSPSVADLSPTSPSQGGSLLYRADWSSGTNGWIGSSEWKVVNGKLLSDGTNAGYNAAPVGSDSFMSPYRPTTTNYAIEARIQILDTPNNCYLAIRGRVQTDGSGYDGYFVGFDSFYGDADIGYFSPAAGFVSITSQSFGPGVSEHLYRAEFRDNLITLKIDNHIMVQTTDNRFINMGQVGLENGDCQISVSSFEVLAL